MFCFHADDLVLIAFTLETRECKGALSSLMASRKDAHTNKKSQRCGRDVVLDSKQQHSLSVLLECAIQAS